MSATQSDDWYEESSPNLAATLDPNDHILEDNTNHSDGSDETNVLFTNCSLPTPFFRWEMQYPNKVKGLKLLDIPIQKIVMCRPAQEWTM